MGAEASHNVHIKGLCLLADIQQPDDLVRGYVYQRKECDHLIFPSCRKTIGPNS